MIDENRIEGTARKIGGKLEDMVGGATGNASGQAEGKFTQAAGAAQDMGGQVVDEIKTFTSAKPLTTLLSVMGIGVLLGFCLRRH